MNASVLHRLRDWLRDASLADGARLPPERALAERLCVTRAELRKALDVLQAEGRLVRHVGRGTFLRDPVDSRSARSGALAAIAERTSPHEAMAARMVLEPELARLAALNGSARQIAELKRLAREMREVDDWDSYEELDSAFHDLIAESAGNPLLLEVSRIVNGVRQAVVWGRLYLPKERPTPDYHSFREHDDIVAALEARDRGGARQAMRRHIESTLGTMMAGD